MPMFEWALTIVVLSRLVYRKGIDLLVPAIPRICQQCPNVRFLIGGDGPKRIDLEQMREKYQLQERVVLLGGVPHADVHKVLIQGDIFLNTSLTEAFCIAIVEAASFAAMILLIVSTNVGGIPEVLPRHMVTFAAPEEDEIVKSVINTVRKVSTRVHNSSMSPWKFHQEVKEMYSWHNVARRTEQVYYDIVQCPEPPLIERLWRYHQCGLFAGKLFCMVVAVDTLLLLLFEWIWPRRSIEVAPDFPCEKYHQ
ncbi:Phosphatidylinositol N-acetylglucosaminyltransferase GPI3 subunit, partial [Spiromyces aspiralis]